MPLFVWVICAALMIFVIDFVMSRMRFNKYIKVLPKIPLAVIVPFLRPNQTSVEIFQCIEKVINHYNGLASFWIGTKPVIICDDPVNMKTILLSKDCISKPSFYRMLSVAGNGIFSAKGIPFCLHPFKCVRFEQYCSFGSARLAYGSQKYKYDVHFEHPQKIDTDFQSSFCQFLEGSEEIC